METRYIKKIVIIIAASFVLTGCVILVGTNTNVGIDNTGKSQPKGK